MALILSLHYLAFDIKSFSRGFGLPNLLLRSWRIIVTYDPFYFTILSTFDAEERIFYPLLYSFIVPKTCCLCDVASVRPEALLLAF